MVKVLKSCPGTFNHLGNRYIKKDLTEAQLEKLAKDPTFKHIIPEEKKPESKTATAKKASAKED